MSFSSSASGFPTINTYADAKAHFDKVRPIRGDLETDPKPIAGRATNQRHKNMRQLHDGSIAFRLHRTDCVIWHPGDQITIEGYPSISTGVFIHALTPHGIEHGIGSRNNGSPVLTLRPQINSPIGDHRSYWRSGTIIQCNRPVRLHYTADTWLPVEPETLEPFTVATIDSRLSRAAAAKYRLAQFEKVVAACHALRTLPPVYDNLYGGINAELLSALEEGNFGDALRFCPRGDSFSFGKWHGTSNGVQPGFLKKLRDFVYAHEHALTYSAERMLTRSQYERHLAMDRRF